MYIFTKILNCVFNPLMLDWNINDVEECSRKGLLEIFIMTQIPKISTAMTQTLKIKLFEKGNTNLRYVVFFWFIFHLRVAFFLITDHIIYVLQDICWYTFFFFISSRLHVWNVWHLVTNTLCKKWPRTLGFW